MPEQPRDWFADPPPRRTGALALIRRGTRLLIVSRPYRQAVSLWGLPGGSAAANELPGRAVSRHLADRLTLRASPGRLIAVDHVPEQPGRHYEGTNFVYRVRILDDAEPEITASAGFGEVRWVERDEVHRYAVDHSLRRIEQCLLADDARQTTELFLGAPLHACDPGQRLGS